MFAPLAAPGKIAIRMSLDEPVRRYLAHAVRGGDAPSALRLEMTGRIRIGAWLPFTAVQHSDGRSFTWTAAVGPLRVVDRYADGAGSTEGRLLGRLRLFRSDDAETARSAAGRAALESIFVPASLLPGRGIAWRAECEDHIVATFDLPPERPEVHLRIDEHGGLRSACALRWRGGGYVPCGCDVHEERTFGDLTIPGRFTVAWGYGTPRAAPFFRAAIRDARPA